MNLSHFRFLEWLILENAFYRCGANVCICEKQTNTFMCELFFSCILKYSYKNRKRSLHFRTYESFFLYCECNNDVTMTSQWRHQHNFGLGWLRRIELLRSALLAIFELFIFQENHYQWRHNRWRHQFKKSSFFWADWKWNFADRFQLLRHFDAQFSS